MLKRAVKQFMARWLGEESFEYGLIWYQIHIKANYFPLGEAFWEKPLFVHIPKTAGNSIHETADVSSAMGHRSIRFYRKKLPAHKAMPFSFSVVRNPYDRLCSSFYYLKKGGNSMYDQKWARKNLSAYADVNDFVQNGLKKEKINRFFHFLPQLHFITGKDGDLAVDFIMRFERLNEDWKKLAPKLQVSAELPKKNVTESGSKTAALTRKSRELVHQFYRSDFSKLGYKK